jgi:hypothetical protein
MPEWMFANVTAGACQRVAMPTLVTDISVIHAEGRNSQAPARAEIALLLTGLLGSHQRERLGSVLEIRLNSIRSAIGKAHVHAFLNIGFERESISPGPSHFDVSSLLSGAPVLQRVLNSSIVAAWAVTSMHAQPGGAPCGNAQPGVCVSDDSTGTFKSQEVWAPGRLV